MLKAAHLTLVFNALTPLVTLVVQRMFPFVTLATAALSGTFPIASVYAPVPPSLLARTALPAISLARTALVRRLLALCATLATNSVAPLAPPPAWLNTAPLPIHWSAFCAMPNVLSATRPP